MKKITKIISSVGAAALIGTGVYVGTSSNEKPSKEDNFMLGAPAVIDDVKPSTVSIPIVKIPEIKIPHVDIPQVNGIIVISSADIEKCGISADYAIDMPTIETIANQIPEIHKVIVDNPNITTAELLDRIVIIPEIDDNSFNGKIGVEIGNVEIGSIKSVSIEKTSVGLYNVKTPSGKLISVSRIDVASLVSEIPELEKIVIDNPQITVEELVEKVKSMPSINYAQVKTAALNIPKIMKTGVNSFEVKTPSGKLISVSRIDVASLVSEIPELEKIVIDNPQITVEELVEKVKSMPSINYAQVKTAALNIPKIHRVGTNIYEVKIPSGKTVTVRHVMVASLVSEIPELEQFVIENPSITTQELIKKIVTIPNIDSNVIKEILISIPTVQKADDRIPLIQEFVKKLKKMFKDKRYAKYDNSLVYDNKDIHEWMKIYKEFKNDQNIEFVKLTNSMKMIAEVHHPIDIDILNKNLDFYSKYGYNSVLVTFGFKDENFNEILTVAEYIKSLGFKIWFAYSGKETLHDTIYIKPKELDMKLRRFAYIAEGFIIGWRRTSVHLVEQDEPFKYFMINSVRKANPNIQILGEAYYGQTASSNENTHHIEYNVPKNSSGAMIMGLGFNNIVVSYVLNNVFAQVKEMDRIGVILGDKPYYGTRFDNHKSFMDNFMIKEKIVKEWMNAGTVGTITIHGDGSDGNYGKHMNDNIAQMPAE